MSSPPPRRYFVRIAGKERVVDLREQDGAFTVTLDGEPWSADLALLSEPSLHSLLLNGHSREMVLSKKGEMVQVSLDGQTIEVRVLDELARALAEAADHVPEGPSEILAPMPGVIAAVLVKPGENVDAGRAVIVLEAMKMQNELTSDASGIVERILVSPGDSVAGGAVLMQLSPEPVK